MITQSLNQIIKTYTQYNSIIDNCHARMFFTPNDKDTAKYISDMLGMETIIIKNKSYNNRSIFDRSYSEYETKRELMTPDEVLRLPIDDSIVFLAGASR